MDEILTMIKSPTWIFTVLVGGLIIGLVAAIAGNRLDDFLRQRSTERSVKRNDERDQLADFLARMPTAIPIWAANAIDARILAGFAIFLGTSMMFATLLVAASGVAGAFTTGVLIFGGAIEVFGVIIFVVAERRFDVLRRAQSGLMRNETARILKEAEEIKSPTPAERPHGLLGKIDQL